MCRIQLREGTPVEYNYGKAVHLQNTTRGMQCTCRIQLGEGSACAEYNYGKAVHLQNTTRGRQSTYRIQLGEGSAPVEYN